MIFLKSPTEIDAMDRANRVVHSALKAAQEAAAPGVSTFELDSIAEALIRQSSGVPAFKGYRGFPGTLCTSINDVIVHGIPRKDERLKEGDIISVDCGVLLDGFYGDAAVTFAVGSVDNKTQRLIDTTRQSLVDAVDKVRVGNRLGDVGAAVQRLAEEEGYGVVRDFVGHGIGRSLHEDPQVPNYGREGRGQMLKAGLVIAIEPMITLGSWRVKIDEDGWTARTEDGTLSAHFEFSVAVLPSGPRVLGLEKE